MKKAVLLITFNRLYETKKTFEQIALAKPPRLYLASDGARPNKVGEKEKVEEIRAWLLENVNWDCDVKTRFLETNSGGCRYGVSGAIDWFFESEEDGIIVEDDIVASQSFFFYCEELLDKYKDNKKIWHIAGDSGVENIDLKQSYYFATIQLCWGWATWKDRWQNYHKGLKDYDGTLLKQISNSYRVQSYWIDILHKMQRSEIDAWDYQWTFIIIENNGLCINPTKNLTSNIGYTGVHYEDSFNNPDLGRLTYDLDKIIHPESIEPNLYLDDRIFKERFKLCRASIKQILKFMWRKPLFLFRKDFYRLFIK